MKPGRDAQHLVDAIVAAIGDEPDIAALFLGGSHGRGTADRFSDFDFVGLVESERQPAVSALWRRTLEKVSPIVYWSERQGVRTLINAITDDWRRIDLWMVAPASFGQSGAYAQSNLRCLLDRGGIFATLPAAPPQSGVDRGQVEFLIKEFIRVLGLIAVGLGRKELVLGVTGVGLLRDLLIRLMVEQTQSPDRGGMLHLSRTITAGQMAELEALPYPSPVRDEILEAHWALAERFFPRAKAMAAGLDIAWPEAFENATAAHLRRAFGDTFRDWRPEAGA